MRRKYRMPTVTGGKYMYAQFDADLQLALALADKDSGCQIAAVDQLPQEFTSGFQFAM